MNPLTFFTPRNTLFSVHEINKKTASYLLYCFLQIQGLQSLFFQSAYPAPSEIVLVVEVQLLCLEALAAFLQLQPVDISYVSLAYESVKMLQHVSCSARRALEVFFFWGGGEGAS